MSKRLHGLLLFLFLAGTGLLSADDWPQWRGPERDGVWRETGIVEKLPRKLTYLWRTPVGMGYAGPAVAAGRVYLMDRVLGAGEANPDNPFNKKRVSGRERVLCFDAAGGKLLWKHSYASNYTISYPYGPRTTPTVSGGKVYCLGAMGDLLCLDASRHFLEFLRFYDEKKEWRSVLRFHIFEEVLHFVAVSVANIFKAHGITVTFAVIGF